MRVYLLSEDQLGPVYESVEAAVAAQSVTSGTVYIVPQVHVRKLGLTSDPPSVSIVSDDPVT